MADLGPAYDNGIQGPDEDGDEWTDDIDNCPTMSNPEQRDRDQDGVGDMCDSCPATPNGTDQRVGQSGCETMNESEPNDQPTMGEPVSLVELGKLREVRGAIEAPTEDRQAFDRFSVMVPARTMLRVRASRASSESLLEPMIVVSGGGYTAPRSAHGLFFAEREIYVAEAGTYEIAVADRVGVLNGRARGDSSFAYALSIEAIEPEIQTLAPPFENRTFELSPAGSVRLFEAQLEPAELTRIATETDLGRGFSREGLDVVLIVELDDGATVIENDSLAEGFLDARVILNLDTSQLARITLDHTRVVGAGSLDVRLTIDQPPSNIELEPNDNFELASKLVYPGETAGRINAPVDQNVGPPDIDWYYFDGIAGQVVAFSGIIPGASNADPIMVLGYLLDDEFQRLYVNTNSSGLAPRIEALLYDDRRFYLGVAHEPNLGMPPFEGGPVFDYGIFAEVVGLQPNPQIITSTETFSGELASGGRLARHLVTTDQPTVLSLRTEQLGGDPLPVPQIRVYGPSARGLIGDGIDTAFAYLPAGDTYVIAVNNADNGLGAAGTTYEILAHLNKGVPATQEVEPNDLEDSETSLGAASSVGIGEQLTIDDIDRFSVDLTQGEPVNITCSIGQIGRQLALFDDGGAMVANGAQILAFDPPMSGTYSIEVTTVTPSTYTLIVSSVIP